jgi:mannose-6-phosphate isomerase-like protein (cupin superfamily)
MVTHQTGEGTHWEMHPAGDEVLYLLSGRMDVVLHDSGSERVLSLRPGTAVIVPQGIWHTVKIHGAGDLLSITRGAGTEIRPE